MARQNKTRGKTVSRALFDNAKEFFEKYGNDVTRNTYMKNYRKFIDYCRTNFNCKTKEKCGEHIQEYADCLKEKGYTPSTIHTYLAPVCVYHDISMDKIKKDLRRTAHYKRGRTNNEKTHRSDNDIKNSKHQRSVEFQSVVGIRRAELSRLTGKDLVTDESGYLCVRVGRGKGGKLQLQRILPQHYDMIKSYFKDKKPDERIFTKEELNNKVSYHTLRAQNAQRCYEYYLNRLNSEDGYREQLTQEIVKRHQKYCIDKKTGKPKKFDYHKIQGFYHLRGANKELANANGLPTKYDRLALMAVSIFHLSHWRNDVTVQSYILAI